MIDLFKKVLNNYETSLAEPFAEHTMAELLRTRIPSSIRDAITENKRYLVRGSAGKGQWTFAPWIAILDLLVTDTPQSGYYPVYLFKEDFSGFYLSLNQGVTDIKEKYKRDAISILKIKAQDYRTQLFYRSFPEFEIRLNGKHDHRSKDAKYYEAGNIVAKYYSKDKLPSDRELVEDLKKMLSIYRLLIYNEVLPINKAEIEEDEERFKGTEDLKKFRLHKKLERNSNLSKKVKLFRGYTCEGCNLNFEEKYGEIGRGFIEAHHLTPLSNLEGQKINLDVRTDFLVLCSNCHRMIHRLDDVSDINLLKSYLKKERI